MRQVLGNNKNKYKNKFFKLIRIQKHKGCNNIKDIFKIVTDAFMAFQDGYGCNKVTAFGLKYRILSSFT
jgi:hypothetical protein